MRPVSPAHVARLRRLKRRLKHLGHTRPAMARRVHQIVCAIVKTASGILAVVGP